RYEHPPEYGDVVSKVGAFLRERAEKAQRAGVHSGAIVIDPGLGFGKTVEQNLELVRRAGELLALGYPLLSAASRKSFVGWAMGLRESAPTERLPGSLAFTIAHYLAGVRLFRVHDVGAHVRALSAIRAIR